MTNMTSTSAQNSNADLMPPVNKQTVHATVSFMAEKIVKLDKKARVDPRLVCLLKSNSSAAENYSQLRHAIENLSQPYQAVVVAVTSPEQGDGKTLTAINLAAALAKNPRAKVLLIDMDLRQPGANICDYLNLKNLAGPGIVDLIMNSNLNSEQIIHYISDVNLYLANTGAKTDLPYEILKSRRLEVFIEKVRQQFDFVILDTSHVNQLPDTLLISDYVDGFVIVIKADTTPQNSLEETLNSMRQEKVLGLVFNGSNANN